MTDKARVPKVENSEFIRALNLAGILAEQNSQYLLEKFEGNALSILVHLISEGSAKKDELCKLWGDSLGFAHVNLDKTLFQQDAVQKIPEKFARRHNMIAIYKFGESITVATSDPGNNFIQKELARLIGCPVSLVFAFPYDIEDAIEIQYKNSTVPDDPASKMMLDPLFSEDGKISLDQLKSLADDKLTVEFTRCLLLFGIKECATDIHIDPGKEEARVRFRIDGVLEERMNLDKSLHALIISRLKILAGADITQMQIPQNGRISLSLLNRIIDIRLSTAPTIYGEKIVLRISEGLRKYSVPDLSQLCFSKYVCQNLTRVIESPNGVFFVAGPTGSGKTTTLYSALRHINKTGINIMTVEDPVEYQLEGINQVQVNPAAGLNFASALRSFLEQDPDVILVGEMRDAETVKIAFQAALAGHLIFTTLHANSALEAVVRLVEMGAEPFWAASSVIGVMAQRLVRRLCDQCKEKYELMSEEIKRIFLWDGKKKVFFYRRKGCPYCSHTGFSGRIAIHELFIINSEVRTLIAKNASFSDIRRSSDIAGFQSMRYDGIKKTLRGLTTIEEINRVTTAEEEL